MSLSKTILVTGANGFLGRSLCYYFSQRGFSVRGLVRRPELKHFDDSDIQLFKGDLPDEIDPEAFEGVHIVIHCAYTTQLTDQDRAYRVNHLGTIKVYEMSKSARVGRFVFVSSTGAHPGAESYYGKSKYALEQKMDSSQDLIIRPGLILGPGEMGSFNRMKETLRKSGMVPIFGGGKQILQVIHIDDLIQGIDLAIQKELTGLFVIAEPEGLEIKEFFKKVASGLGKKCTLIPLPMAPMLLLFRIIENLHIPFPLSSENLLGLKTMRHMPSSNDLERIGISVRGLDQALKDAMKNG